MDLRVGKKGAGNYVVQLAESELAYTFADYDGDPIYLTILGRGNVGIGTVSPQGKLEVSHDGTSHDLVVNSSTGNVGIGTTDPGGYNVAIQGTGNDLYLSMSEDRAAGADGFEFQITPGTGAPQTRIGYLRGNFGHGNGFYIYNERNAPLRFGTNSSERIRVTGNGNVGIGTMSPSSKLHVANGCITGSMCSDIRLKKNIEPLPDDSILDRVMGLQAVTFEWKHREDGKRQIGLIAQDVEEVFPEVVTTPDDNTCEKGLLATGMDAVLVEAIKELKVENELLKDRLEALERIIQQHQFAVAKEVQQ